MGNTLSTDRRYLILVRHASRDFDSERDESKQSMSGWRSDFRYVKPDFKVNGLPRTLAIANRLADELSPVKVARIRHSPHTVAEQTAMAYHSIIAERTGDTATVEASPALDPDSGSATGVETLLQQLTNPRELAAGSAVILVGHQPMLTLIARSLMGKNLFGDNLPAGTLPLGSSEAACLEIHGGKGATLLWMLTEKTAALMDDLKEKIRSKYDVAKFFLGAFVVNTGFILSGEIWKVSNPFDVALVLVGFVATLVALALTAATLMSYDRLLMPTEFWTGTTASGGNNSHPPRPKRWSVLRPPSQAQVVLFYEMVHVWNVFFVPALTCAFVAVAAFLVALAHNSLYPGTECAGDSSSRCQWLLNCVGLPWLILATIVAAAALLLPLALHYLPRRPNLGFDD